VIVCGLLRAQLSSNACDALTHFKETRAEDPIDCSKLTPVFNEVGWEGQIEPSPFVPCVSSVVNNTCPITHKAFRCSNRQREQKRRCFSSLDIRTAGTLQPFVHPSASERLLEMEATVVTGPFVHWLCTAGAIAVSSARGTAVICETIS